VAPPRHWGWHQLHPTWAEELVRAAGIRRGDLVLAPGMGIEIEPNACIGMRRINLGAAVVVTQTQPEQLNDLPSRVWHQA